MAVHTGRWVWMVVSLVASALMVGGWLLFKDWNREPVRIGILGEMTGRSADIGVAMRNGALIAVDEFKGLGRLRGAEVEVLVRDAGDTPDAAEHAAREIVAAKPLVVIGPVNSATVEAVLPLMEAADVVLMAPAASAVKLSGRDDHLFRGNWTTRENGSNYAQHYYHAGFRSVAVAINQNNRAFSQSWFEEFQRAYEPLGGKVVASEYFDSSDSGLDAMVQKLLAPGPDALIFIANAADVARLAQQTRKRDATTPLIAAEWAGTTTLIQQGGKAVEGLRIVQNVNQDDTTPRYQAFLAAYRERFSKDPEYVSILAYDVAAAALQAHLRRSKGTSLKQALLTQGPFDGLQQPVKFNATGDNERAAFFMVVRDGHYVRE